MKFKATLNIQRKSGWVVESKYEGYTTEYWFPSLDEAKRCDFQLSYDIDRSVGIREVCPDKGYLESMTYKFASFEEACEFVYEFKKEECVKTSIERI